jgi:serine/threonine-protein kinase
MIASEDSVLGQTLLGRYRIVRKLAQGGMGAVYLGRTEGAEGFARPVVIKRVLPTLMGDAEVAQLFVREARILANLQHPNIVGVIDFGQQTDRAYVTIFEYVNGYSLAEYCRYLTRTREHISVDIALHIVGRVLDALEYAHTLRKSDGTALHIVHRDVSPSNILLSEQGTIKLLDFGIAQMSGEPAELQTSRPRIRGKLPYVPLEIFKGEQATVRTDVYSAGVVLYQLLTGTNPFAGREAADIIHKVAHAVPASVHATRDDAPEDIDAVLMRALDRDPKRRYASAAEFAAALRPLRKEAEDLVARQLVERLQRDFSGPMPELLGLEPLATREAAWRNSRAPEASEMHGQLEVEVDASESPHEAVTVQASINPAALASTKRDTLPVSAYDDASALSPAPSPSPSPVAAASSNRRLAWLAGLSSLIGAVAAAGVWFAVDRSPAQPIVVVERPQQAQASAAAVPLLAAPAPVQPKTEPEPPAAATTAAAADTAADEAEPAPAEAADHAPPREPKHDPPPPNPRALTRTFERRHKHVEACFDRHATALSGQPQLSLHFQLDVHGEVQSADIEPPSLADTALGRCLVDVARATHFEPQQHAFSFRIPITAQAQHAQ